MSSLLNPQHYYLFSRMLFRSQDLSEIKDYCYDCWTKLLEGNVSPQDFVFAKEVKLGSYRCEEFPSHTLPH